MLYGVLLIISVGIAIGPSAAAAHDPRDGTHRPERLRQELLAPRDVAHEVILVDGNIAETVVDVARGHRFDYIYLSSQANTSGGHDITTAILENSAIPVVVIDEDRE